MSRRFLIGTRKGLFRAERTNGSWQIEPLGFVAEPVSIAHRDRRNGAIFAALDLGHFGAKLHRSTDDGRTWQECEAPTYPPQPADEKELDINPVTQMPVPWKLRMIWELADGGRDQPDVMWCGTLPGGLFRSEDGGQHWSLVRSLWDDPARRQWFGGGADLPGIHSICVDPRDSRHVSLGVSCGGAWVTRDGGDTWRCQAEGMRAAYMPPDQAGNPNIQDPHRMAQCASQPDCFWVQHHNGIFRSTDGAASWHEVTCENPSSFGFGVVVHPDDPETAWFVPATKDEQRIPKDGRLVVTRTRDGGKSFDVLTKGLPQQDAYDLVYRHALDLADDGRTLAFGSTTGNLWVSEDQGDSWECLSHHLPPVYCVRFEGS